MQQDVAQAEKATQTPVAPAKAPTPAASPQVVSAQSSYLQGLQGGHGRVGSARPQGAAKTAQSKGGGWWNGLTGAFGASAETAPAKAESGGFWERIGGALDGAADWVGQKAGQAVDGVVDAAEWTNDRLTEAGTAVAAGAQWAGDKAAQGYDWASEKTTQGYDWAAEKAVQGYDWAAEKTNQGIEYGSNLIDVASSMDVGYADGKMTLSGDASEALDLLPGLKDSLKLDKGVDGANTVQIAYDTKSGTVTVASSTLVLSSMNFGPVSSGPATLSDVLVTFTNPGGGKVALDVVPDALMVSISIGSVVAQDVVYSGGAEPMSADLLTLTDVYATAANPGGGLPLYDTQKDSLVGTFSVGSAVLAGVHTGAGQAEEISATGVAASVDQRSETARLYAEGVGVKGGVDASGTRRLDEASVKGLRVGVQNPGGGLPLIDEAPDRMSATVTADSMAMSGLKTPEGEITAAHADGLALKHDTVSGASSASVGSAAIGTASMGDVSVGGAQLSGLKVALDKAGVATGKVSEARLRDFAVKNVGRLDLATLQGVEGQGGLEGGSVNVEAFGAQGGQLGEQRLGSVAGSGLKLDGEFGAERKSVSGRLNQLSATDLTGPAQLESASASGMVFSGSQSAEGRSGKLDVSSAQIEGGAYGDYDVESARLQGLKAGVSVDEKDQITADATLQRVRAQTLSGDGAQVKALDIRGVSAGLTKSGAAAHADRLDASGLRYGGGRLDSLGVSDLSGGLSGDQINATTGEFEASKLRFGEGRADQIGGSGLRYDGTKDGFDAGVDTLKVGTAAYGDGNVSDLALSGATIHKDGEAYSGGATALSGRDATYGGMVLREVEARGLRGGMNAKDGLTTGIETLDAVGLEGEMARFKTARLTDLSSRSKGGEHSGQVGGGVVSGAGMKTGRWSAEAQRIGVSDLHGRIGESDSGLTAGDLTADGINFDVAGRELDPKEGPGKAYISAGDLTTGLTGQIDDADIKFSTGLMGAEAGPAGAIAPGTDLNTSVVVQDGKLVPKQTYAKLSKGTDAPLWISAWGAYLEKAGPDHAKIRADLSGWSDVDLTDKLGEDFTEDGNLPLSVAKLGRAAAPKVDAARERARSHPLLGEEHPDRSVDDTQRPRLDMEGYVLDASASLRPGQMTLGERQKVQIKEGGPQSNVLTAKRGPGEDLVFGVVQMLLGAMSLDMAGNTVKADATTLEGAELKVGQDSSGAATFSGNIGSISTQSLDVSKSN